MQNIGVKICGLSRPNDVVAAAQAGARYVGFVFFPKSPRNVDVAAAQALAVEVPVGIAKVALMVNPTDEEVDAVNNAVPLDMLQLHGSESAERVVELRARTGLPVMKAVGIAEATDLEKLATYEKVADQILVDAKPPKNADLPGGNGLSFDWRLVSARRWTKPWMLAGGLGPENVAEAIALTGTTQVDVSSGVESAPGVKDADKIKAFCEAAMGLHRR